MIYSVPSAIITQSPGAKAFLNEPGKVQTLLDQYHQVLAGSLCLLHKGEDIFRIAIGTGAFLHLLIVEEARLPITAPPLPQGKQHRILRRVNLRQLIRTVLCKQLPHFLRMSGAGLLRQNCPHFLQRQRFFLQLLLCRLRILLRHVLCSLPGLARFPGFLRLLRNRHLRLRCAIVLRRIRNGLQAVNKGT